jgi:hypothetical protein
MQKEREIKLAQAIEIAKRIANDLEDAATSKGEKHYRLVLLAYSKTLSLEKLIRSLKQ